MDEWKGKQMECIAIVSARCDMRNVEQIEKLEKRQEAYIRKYAKAHGVKIVGVIYGNGQGQGEINKKFLRAVELIRYGKVQGMIAVNMAIISADLEDAYCKVGKVRSAGGEMITVDEGRLRLSIYNRKGWRKE